MPRWKPSIKASYRVEAERLSQRRGSIPHQTHHFLKMRTDHGEVRLATRLAPHLLAGGVGACLRLDEVRWHRGGARIGVAHQAEVRRAPGIRFSYRLRFRQVVADDRRDKQRVRHPCQHGKLIAACRAAAGRHHCCGIPAQQRRRLADRCDAREACGEPVIRGHSSSAFLAQRTKITTSATARPYQVIA